MFTSRAEHRLLLREDNADLRLTELGHAVGAVSEADRHRAESRRESIESVKAQLNQVVIKPSAESERALGGAGTAALRKSTSLAELLRRPELSFADVCRIADLDWGDVRAEVAAQVEIDIKYDGYIKRQQVAIDRLARMESATIPANLDFGHIPGLSREVGERLAKVRPTSLGQASRISGVTPAAISLLAVHLKRQSP
jgi:tRNA uridine 5-carboxymethylaminomethyl modification enzyme